MKALSVRGVGRRARIRQKIRTARRVASGVGVAVPCRSSGMRVLVVDDNPDAAELFAEILRDAGHVVDVAVDGVEALTCALRAAPDVALIDIGLPGMDGYEVARSLRAACPSGSFRLIAVTGYGQDCHREQSCAAGFDLHLTKPIDIDGLALAIKP